MSSSDSRGVERGLRTHSDRKAAVAAGNALRERRDVLSIQRTKTRDAAIEEALRLVKTLPIKLDRDIQASVIEAHDPFATDEIKLRETSCTTHVGYDVLNNESYDAIVGSPEFQEAHALLQKRGYRVTLIMGGSKHPNAFSVKFTAVAV